MLLNLYAESLTQVRSMQTLSGKQLFPPENKFGKGYEHGKNHFSTRIRTVVLVRIIRFAILKRLVPEMFRTLSLGRRSGGPQSKRLITKIPLKRFAS